MNIEVPAQQPESITTRQLSTHPSVDPPMDRFFIIIPEETIAQTAARFRAFQAARLADPVDYVDVDIPFVDDGADW